MKKKTPSRAPARNSFTVLRQLCKLIPRELVTELALETGVQQMTRTFSAWSHTVALLFAQLTHALGLNDVCDSLRLHCSALLAIGGATPPSRNNLSHANKRRPAQFMEKLFHGVLAHLQALSPGFGTGRRGRGLAHRFKTAIHVIDATTISLVANCLDWANHRYRKAAAKCHLRIDLRSQLPRFAIIDTAREGDGKRARELCAGIRKGEIALFDKAYIDLAHLLDLTQRGVFWVTRAKEDMAYKVVKKRLKKALGSILRDDEIILSVPLSREKYPLHLRRVHALVEVDGEQREMLFLTNNLAWEPSSVAELYRCRWQIELFFKELKQTLQLCDFLGNSANAVRWQLWSALLCYVLLRFQAWLSQWSSSFSRLWAVIRSALWLRVDLAALLKSYGTAGGSFRLLGQPEALWLPGLAPDPVG